MTCMAKLWKNDNKVWSALQFLIKCKETIDGFDYRILRGKAGNPTAILYMTSRMQYNLNGMAILCSLTVRKGNITN